MPVQSRSKSRTEVEREADRAFLRYQKVMQMTSPGVAWRWGWIMGQREQAERVFEHFAEAKNG